MGTLAETPMTRVRTIAMSTLEPPRGRPVAWRLIASLPMLLRIPRERRAAAAAMSARRLLAPSLQEQLHLPRA